MKAPTNSELSEFIESWVKNHGIKVLQDGYRALLNDADKFENKSSWLEGFKTKCNQTVTDGEIEFERLLREAIDKAFSGQITLWGEEWGDEAAEDGKIIAAIDPIDGTSCMLASVAYPDKAGEYGFGISVGWIKDGKFWGGHIFTLEGGRSGLRIKDVWSGWEGGKAYKNAKPIEIPKSPSDYLYSTAPSIMFQTSKDTKAFWAVEKTASKVVVDQNCTGFMDAIEKGASAIEQDLSVHDIAAIVPIIKAGGMRVANFDGSEISVREPRESYSLHCAPSAVFIKQRNAILKNNEAPQQRSTLFKALRTTHAKKFDCDRT